MTDTTQPPAETLAAICDGKEQPAFEAWAASQRFDMTEHPLHYLFLDARTDAARSGWKAGLAYATEIALAALSRHAGGDAGTSVTCAAVKQGTAGGNEPADCDWPVCGCDPHAGQVIAALEESGYLKPPAGGDAGAGAFVVENTDGKFVASFSTQMLANFFVDEGSGCYRHRDSRKSPIGGDHG